MWCSTCAKNIREAVLAIEGVASAEVNYASKLLIVKTKIWTNAESLDQAIQTRIEQIGFGIKRQPEDWVLNFHKELEEEFHRTISWTQVSIVWFLAMWSSMFAFSTYLGSLSKTEFYFLSLASAAFGIPAVLIGCLPYAKSGLRTLIYGRFITLDLFIFFGALAAVFVSVASLTTDTPNTYADSASMIIALLLLTKKIENTVVQKVTSRILFELHPKNKQIFVLKNEEWKMAEVSQIRKGDLVRVMANETVAFDGTLESSEAYINNHMISGENTKVLLKKGDDILAGSIASSDFEIAVSSPQGKRKIDGWAEKALISESQKGYFSKNLLKFEKSLVLFAFSGALFIATVHFLKGEGLWSVVEAFFIGVLIFCPCLFASIIPITKQLAHFALLRKGILMSRSEALWDLNRIQNFYFDKTGTLEAVESGFVAFDDGDRAKPYLNELAIRSQHTTLRGLISSFGPSEITSPLDHITEHPGQGVLAIAKDGVQILAGRMSFLKDMGVPPLANPEPAFSYVALDKKIVGQIVRKSVYDSKSKHVLKKLLKLKPDIHLGILSGDPSHGAGDTYCNLDKRISYQGNLSPEDKVKALKAPAAFIGDGLNDTLALSQAQVSFKIGQQTMGFAPVDFQLLRPNLNLVFEVIRYSKRYQRILIQTACASFLYNVIALTLAAMGKFSPLGAVLAMLGSFSIMLLSVLRLQQEGVKK